jgi:hypothetical protein
MLQQTDCEVVTNDYIDFIYVLYIYRNKGN